MRGLQYFKEQKHCDILVAFLQKEYPSRLIEYFLQKYTKDKSIAYYYNNRLFYIHEEYRRMISIKGKKQFDIFRRDPGQNAINVLFKGKNTIQMLTTEGQLNLYAWMIRYDVIYEFEKHYDDVRIAIQRKR